MIYYIFIEVILLAFIICLIFSVYRDYKSIKDAPQRILILAVLAIIFKSSWGFMFYGLEYEDAYAFAFSARQFANNIYSSSFLVDGISIGSLDNPVSMGCYGGHFITFSVYLSNFFRLFGYSEGVMAWAQLLTTFVVLVLLSLFKTRNRRWIIAPIVYCLAPMMNVFGTSMLGETFSSMVCLSFIYFVANKKNRYFALIAFFLALLCKRENLIILVVPLCFAIKGYIEKLNRDYKDIALQIGQYVIVCVLYFLCIKNVFAIEALESKDIQTSTFSPVHFIQLFPVFIKSLLNLRYFGIVFYATVLLLIYQVTRKNITTRQIILGVLYLCYLLLYTSHYRGYDYVYGLEEVSELETFRYLNNFYYLLPLICSDIKIPLSSRFVSVGSGVLLLISIVLTSNMRKISSNEEFVYNFKECTDVTNLISKMGSRRYVVITDRILTYQVMMPSWFNVCDIRNIGNLNPNIKGYDFFIVYQGDFSYLQKRYGVNVDTSRIIKLRQINDNRYVYKYNIR